MRTDRLTRPVTDRVIGGVCAGFARHTGLPVAGIRIVTAVLSIAGGIGIAMYAWLWATVPNEQEPLAPLKDALTKPAATPRAAAAEPEPSSENEPGIGIGRGSSATDTSSRARRTEPHDPREFRRRVPVAELLLGVMLLAAGIALLLAHIGAAVPLHIVLPLLSVVAGVGLTWWQLAHRSGSRRAQIVRLVGALTLVALGVLMFFVTGRTPDVWTVVAASLSVLVGVGIAVAPWLLKLNRELIAERTGRAREAERAEIAAHLHDSVLQTLALIQQQSPPQSDIARIARGQERELRSWLFRASDAQSAEHTPARGIGSLEDHAADLERHHGVRFDVVVVGEDSTAPESLIAAAKEAMLNAARHAGGVVTVFAEVREDQLLIDITDRGPGFDVESLPSDRMGVRGSIMGRMRRAGGTATFLAGPGGSGTSVRLSMPRTATTGVDDPQPKPEKTEGATGNE